MEPDSGAGAQGARRPRRADPRRALGRSRSRTSPGIVDRVVVLHRDDCARGGQPDSRRSFRRRRSADRFAGGATRQESVLAGVRATDPSARDVLVHDAARPFVKPGPHRGPALRPEGLAGGAARDAAERDRQARARDGSVISTLPRNEIRLASTPQGGRRSTLLRLLEDAVRSRADVTDEASLFERAGVPPMVVDDDPDQHQDHPPRGPRPRARPRCRTSRRASATATTSTASSRAGR